MAAYREDLDGVPCSAPGCCHDTHDNGFFLHSKCHPGEPTWVQYLNGNLFITCAKCKAVIVVVAVASKENRQPSPVHSEPVPDWAQKRINKAIKESRLEDK